ncbi:MAG: F0F1 ATP synthase subunit alpha, partial [Ruminococcus sp.]|nr:F0F1 ATP synthase subunit alpha [Ruminococcus sp.]
MNGNYNDYIQYLVSKNVPLRIIDKTRGILEQSDDIKALLKDKSLSENEKKSALKGRLPQEMLTFAINVYKNGDEAHIKEIFDAYYTHCISKQGCVKATVRYVTPLTTKQQSDMENFIRDRFNTSRVNIEYRKDPEIVGGFVLQVGDFVYDKSFRTGLKLMREKLVSKASSADENALQKDPETAKVNSSDIISVLRSEVDDFRIDSKSAETGYIQRIGDGIAIVEGLSHVMYGELLEFETGVRGIVQNIERNSCGVVLLGDDYGLTEGSAVSRTKKRAGVGVGEALLGRVVDALGSPIDGLGYIEAVDYFPIEREAPGVIDRKPVTVPLQTGILAIDSMFPIGRGQRELIIGDRQTGKTSIAIDTIINQKDKDVICVYVAIGQKSSTVAKVVNTLKAHNAMSYSIVVSASASEPAPFQYIAPYSGTAMAEYFVSKGKDVLIIYDDLSKHAVAYRAMSLLLHRPPGREAYPGDVFYLHSRLLERSCRLDDEHGGGSLTALPIIETLAGDVSAYIPTNVISITDGQIYLESELFFAGVRPAVNVGLSVSRVGGSAQTKAVKKLAGTLRIDLAQFKEMEVFTQFSSELDPATSEMLNHGHMLTEILKQPLCKPYSHYEQVIVLFASTGGYLKDMPLSKVRDFRQGIVEYIKTYYPDIIREIEDKKQLSDELSLKLEKAVKEYLG